MYCLACGIKDVKELNQVKIEKDRCNYNVQNSKHMYVNIFCDNTCHHMMLLLHDKGFVFLLLKSIHYIAQKMYLCFYYSLN